MAHVPSHGDEKPTKNSEPTGPWYTPKTIWKLLREAGAGWMSDKAPTLGAALAFYSILSLAPLLVIVVAIAGPVFGTAAAQGRLAEEIEGIVGREGGKAVEAMIVNADTPAAGGMTVVGIVMLLVGAAALFGQLQEALNTIWRVQPRSGQGILRFIRSRFLSFSLVIGTAFLLLASLVVSAALSALGDATTLWGASIWVHLLDNVASFGIIALLFAMIYRFLPDARINWGDVWLGAVLTALLFTAGKFLIGYYLGHSSTASAYGAAGSLVVLLVWLYYSAQIFLFGAEFTKVYSHHRAENSAMDLTGHTE